MDLVGHPDTKEYNIYLMNLKKKKSQKNYTLMNFWKRQSMKIGPMIPHVVQTHKMTVQYNTLCISGFSFYF